MAHRICTVMMGGVLAWAASASAQTLGTSAARRGGMASSSNRVTVLRAAVAPVRTLLSKPVAKIEWVEKTFEEVLEWLRAQSDDKVNVVPRWNALNAEGVDQESSVSLKLVDTDVAEILNEVIGQLSEDRAVMYRGSRNMLRISTRDDFGRDLTGVQFTPSDSARFASRCCIKAV